MWDFAFCACIWPPDFFSVSLSDLQDFRDAVSQASRQSGKPVIEERLLNQILYSLPQLYELNQDLLRELKQRVANWYDTIMYFNICVYWSMWLTQSVHPYYMAECMLEPLHMCMLLVWGYFP